MASIESLVARGTWRIDDSPFVPTGDKIQLDGHYYSDKPPLLQALGAVPYAFMHHVIGMRLNLERDNPPRRWLTIVMVGVPSAVMVALMFVAARWYVSSSLVAALVAALFAVGTLVWPYSLVLMNHVPAASALFASLFVLLWMRRSRTASGGLGFLAGSMAGLAAAFELLAVFPAVALGGLAAWRGRRLAVAFALGALVPVAATIAFDLHISGHVLPPYFRAEGYDYAGSALPVAVGGLHPAHDVGTYALRGLLGDRGLFSHSPLLLWGAAGLALVIARKEHPLRSEATAVALGCLAFAAFIFTWTSDHGGKSYGVRHFTVLVPLLWFFGVFALPQGLATVRTALGSAALALAAAASVLSAYRGVQRTWRVVPAFLYVEARESAPFVTACTGLNDRRCLE